MQAVLRKNTNTPVCYIDELRDINAHRLYITLLCLLMSFNNPMVSAKVGKTISLVVFCKNKGKKGFTEIHTSHEIH